jgi:Ni/Co efflux regulator RcnB
MKNVLFSGVAAAGLLLAASGATAADSNITAAKADAESAMQLVANGRKGGGMKPVMGMIKPHFGGMKPGGHHIGMKPRPGFHGIPKHDIYRRPHRGFILPRYWVQPSFYLSNFGSYGLSAPSNGYYWSRYYDDAVLTDQRGYVQDYRSDINWDANNYGPDRTDDYRQPEYGPSMRPDANAYNWNDDVAFAAPDGSSYSYDGEWDGEYVDPQGRVFEGDWSGTVTRHDGVEGPGYPARAARDDTYYTGPPDRSYSQSYTGPPDREYSRHYTVPRGYEGYERCLKSNGVAGGAIGAILGGVAGNRIAGRGDRLGGSLLGAGLGGLAGVAIEKAMTKCNRHQPRAELPPRGPYYPPQGQYPQHHGWQGGYYYYPQAPMVTVTVVPGSSHTTTTVTEEVYYETVKTYPRKKVVRKWKPKPKPRCICR